MAKGGPGEVQLVQKGTDSVSAKLFNFNNADPSLKSEHEAWLTGNVVPILNRGGSISIVGLASPTDTEKFNMALSKRRAEAVVTFLRRAAAAKNFKVNLQTGAGEYAARVAGMRDNVESEHWRGAVISASLTPPPPPQIPQPAPVPKVERTIFASFLAKLKINDRGATRSDGPAAPQLADWSTDKNLEWYRTVNRTYAQIPATRKLSLIAIYRDDSGSVEYGVSGVEMNTCKVDYNWTKHYWSTGPIILDSWNKVGVLAGHDPDVIRLTEAQAKLWYDDPPAALEKRGYWDFKGKYIKFEDYSKGNY